MINQRGVNPFDRLGIHVIQFPSKRWGFVGTLPAALGDVVPASTADVMGGRAYTAPDGQIVTVKFPSFATEAEARAHTAARGVACRERTC